MLVSCDPVKRHNRLVDKYPYVHKNITQTIHDTFEIIVPEIKHDTSFFVVKETDTFYIEKDRLRIRIIKEFDTLHVEGECTSDTIQVITERIVPLYASEDTAKGFWDRLQLYLPWLIILLITYIFIKKK